MVRASDFAAVGGFTESYDLMMIADFDLWLKLSRLGKAVVVPQALTYYETRPPATCEQIASNHVQLASVLRTRMQDVPFLKRMPYAVGRIFHMLRFHRICA
jgi:hypothetical protein